MASMDIFLLAGLALPSLFSPDLLLIRGEIVPPGEFREVLKMGTEHGFGSATLIGPRVFLTAGHNAKNGDRVTFTSDGKTYEATIVVSPLYPAQDHDIAVGIVSTAVSDIPPATIGGTPCEGEQWLLLGYGCTGHGGGHGEPGILRVGKSTVTSVSGYDVILTAKDNQAALCSGDSGGPGYTLHNGKRRLAGVNSKGDFQVTSYLARTDLAATRDFLRQIADEKQLEICGINAKCDDLVSSGILNDMPNEVGFRQNAD